MANINTPPIRVAYRVRNESDSKRTRGSDAGLDPCNKKLGCAALQYRDRHFLDFRRSHGLFLAEV
jgi:hypothetical protein